MTDRETLARLCEGADASEQRAMLEAAAKLLWHPFYALPVDWEAERYNKHQRFDAMLDAEAYESAAMMLVPEGAEWTLSVAAYEPCLATIPSGDDRVDAVHGAAATPALALSAAAVRAGGE